MPHHTHHWRISDPQIINVDDALRKRKIDSDCSNKDHYVSKFTNIEELISEDLNHRKKGRKSRVAVSNQKIFKREFQVWHSANCTTRQLRNVCNLSVYVLKCQNWVILGLFFEDPPTYCTLFLWDVYLLIISYECTKICHIPCPQPRILFL